MTIALILVFAAFALFLILRDDHDNSYTRREPKSGRENGRKSVYQKSVTPRRNAPAAPKPAQTPAPKPNPVMGPRTVVPEEKQYRPQKLDERFKPGEPEPKYTSTPFRQAGRDAHASEFSYSSPKSLDYSYLDGLDYNPNLSEKTMSSFIAGLQGYCTRENLGGVLGYVSVDPVTGAMEVHDVNDVLMGYLPMKDRAAFHAFNPDRIPCPFAGHIGISTTGRYYADIRIVLPSTRSFVEDSLRGFLG
ncbi:MAG: hypothetical protein J6P62_07940 [Bacteroidales bacterium]|nr:hypothetical protein [Bacteroidales bacterium]